MQSNRRKAIRSVILYLVSLSIAGALLWYLFKDQDLEAMKAQMLSANYSWVLLSMVVSLASHWVRAFRWNLLLKPLGNTSVTTGRTFLAVMVGYVANFVVPRIGELSRCGILKRTDDVPVPAALGTVFTERIVDLLSLLTLTGILLLTEWGRLNEFITDKVSEKYGDLSDKLSLLIILAAILIVLGVVALILIRVYRERLKQIPLFKRIFELVNSILEGVFSIRKLQNLPAFLLSTVFIWGTYFFMAYLILFALPQTSGLGISAGLAVLVMGSFAIAAPVQGGFGAYHILVSGALVLYGIGQDDSLTLATILHSSQVLIITIVGLLSFVVSMIISRKKRKQLQNPAATATNTATNEAAND